MIAVEGDYTSHLLTLTLSINVDSLIYGSVQLDSIILDSDFADMSVAMISYQSEGNEIVIGLYGKLTRNIGKGTITVKGEVLKKGSDLSAKIPVQWSKN